MTNTYIKNIPPKKMWKLIAKCGKHSTVYQYYDHEPTIEEITIFSKIDNIIGEIKLEIIYS